MKVLLAVTNGDLSGAPIHVRDVAIALKNSGHSVSVVVGERGPLSNELKSEGITVVIFRKMRSQITLFHDAENIIKAYKIIGKFNPDVVHCHSSKAGMIFRLAAWLNKTPCIYTIHGWPTTNPSRSKLSTILTFIEVMLRGLTFRYIAVSDFDRIEGITRFRIPDNKIVTIHNGVFDGVNSERIDKTLRNRNLPEIIMVARDDGQKDYDTLFKAINDLAVSVKCVGRGTDSEGFKARAKKLAPKLYSSISFLGIRADVSELLSNADMFVLISHYEGLPISIIEAMRIGLPVIASDVGGVRELVENNNTGFLVQREDHIELKEAIRNYCLDHEKLLTHGRNGRRKFLEEFQFPKMFRSIEKIYMSIKSA